MARANTSTSSTTANDNRDSDTNKNASLSFRGALLVPCVQQPPVQAALFNSTVRTRR